MIIGVSVHIRATRLAVLNRELARSEPQVYCNRTPTSVGGEID